MQYHNHVDLRSRPSWCRDRYSELFRRRWPQGKIQLAAIVTLMRSIAAGKL